MAWQKDPSILSTVGSHRQMAMAFSGQKEKRVKRSSGTIPNYVDRFKPDTVEPSTVRLHQATYAVPLVRPDGTLETVPLTFFPYTEHYDARSEQRTICSAGPYADWKGKAEPCRGCEIFWAEMVTDEHGKKHPSNRMSKRSMYAFSAILMHPHHRVPQVEWGTHQVKMGPNGQPYFEWRRCAGRNCPGCISGAETKPAHRVHWPMGQSHFEALFAYQDDLGRSCKTCKTTNSISTLAWVCKGCGEAIIDYSSTNLKYEEIRKISDNQATCPRCNIHAYLDEVIECATCRLSGHTPVRTGLFDVNINVRRVESNKQVGTQLLISGNSGPVPIPDLPDLATPLALDKIYAPTPMDIQIRKFG